MKWVRVNNVFIVCSSGGSFSVTEILKTDPETAVAQRSVGVKAFSKSLVPYRQVKETEMVSTWPR